MNSTIDNNKARELIEKIKTLDYKDVGFETVSIRLNGLLTEFSELTGDQYHNNMTDVMDQLLIILENWIHHYISNVIPILRELECIHHTESVINTINQSMNIDTYRSWISNILRSNVDPGVVLAEFNSVRITMIRIRDLVKLTVAELEGKMKADTLEVRMIRIERMIEGLYKPKPKTLEVKLDKLESMLEARMDKLESMLATLIDK